MKPSFLIALLVSGAVIAAPAIAETSISKGKSICESAARAQTPAPKSVRVDDKIKSSATTLTYTLKVRNTDDSTTVVTCRVDRATDTPTLTPAS
jgi:hypothetical protein